MKFNFYTVVICIVHILLFTPKAFSQDPNFHIYVCFGQSNMEGQGNIESIDQTVDSRFQIFQAVACSGQPQATWRTATPPLARCYTKLGPADYFGRKMIDNLPSNIKVGIVFVAVSGCKIELFDKVNYQANVNSMTEQWQKDIVAAYGGNPYGKLVELAKLAQKDGVIKGILMHQGESNKDDNTWPSKVKGVYDNLVVDLGLDASKTPFLLGEMLYANQGGVCASHNTIVATVPSVIPNSYIISSEGLTGQDEYHFNAAGYRTLGERYAQKMLTLVKTDNNVPPTITLTAPANEAKFDVGTDITLTADAADADGTVTKVEFYNGTLKLGEDDSSPYSFTIDDASQGNYTFKAIAYDNSDYKVTSKSVTVMVGNPNIELLTNGEFDNATTGWAIQNNSTGVGTMTVVTTASMSGTNALKLCPTTAGTADWHIQLQQVTPLQTGNAYELSFIAKADTARTITAGLQQNADPYTMYLGQQVSLTTENKTFTFPYTSTVTDADARVKFFVGNNKSCVYLDNISFKKLTTTNVRDLQHGLAASVYPNPSISDFTITAEGYFEFETINDKGQVIDKGNGVESTTLSKDYPRGVYILKITQAHKNRVVKLVKQ